MVSIKHAATIVVLAGGFLSVFLWAKFNFFNPYSNEIVIESTLTTFIMLLLPACLAIIASLASKPSLLLLAFVWAAPFSLYFCFTPGVFKYFGATCIAYLISYLFIKLPELKH